MADAEAAKWFGKAAAQDVADAQFMLGVCYRDGTGVTEDGARATECFSKAAAQGDERAMQELKK